MANIEMLKQALLDKIDGKITQEELTKYCVQWSTEHCNWHPKLEPTTPARIREIMNNQTAHIYTERERKQAEFEFNELNKKHGKMRFVVEATNKSNTEWLKVMLNVFDENNDQINFSKFYKILRMY